jgi:hypothetical protein
MDRATIEQHAKRADEHVAEGERHIRRQREIIAELERDGHNTEVARELLATLEVMQKSHLDIRDRLAKMLARLG